MMVALPLFIAGHAPFRWHSEAEWAAWVAAVWGLALGWYAAIGYLPRARAALAESRGSQASLNTAEGRRSTERPPQTPKSQDLGGENVARSGRSPLAGSCRGWQPYPP